MIRVTVWRVCSASSCSWNACLLSSSLTALVRQRTRGWENERFSRLTKSLHGKSTVQVDSEHWTVHSPHQIRLATPPLPFPPSPPTRKKGRPLHQKLSTPHMKHKESHWPILSPPKKGKNTKVNLLDILSKLIIVVIAYFKTTKEMYIFGKWISIHLWVSNSKPHFILIIGWFSC